MVREAYPPFKTIPSRNQITSSLRDLKSILFLTRRGGWLIRVWFINPDLDPGEEGPPFPLSVPDLTVLFADGYEVVQDNEPDVAFPGREDRERVRVLHRGCDALVAEGGGDASSPDVSQTE